MRSERGGQGAWTRAAEGVLVETQALFNLVVVHLQCLLGELFHLFIDLGTCVVCLREVSDAIIYKLTTLPKIETALCQKGLGCCLLR